MRLLSSLMPVFCSLSRTGLDRAVAQAAYHLVSGYPAAAADICRRVIDNTPCHAPALALLAKTQMERNHVDDPVSLLRQAVAAAPRDPGLHGGSRDCLVSRQSARPDRAVQHPVVGHEVPLQAQPDDTQVLHIVRWPDTSSAPSNSIYACYRVAPAQTPGRMLQGLWRSGQVHATGRLLLEETRQATPIRPATHRRTAIAANK
jgi:hypothetical protein